MSITRLAGALTAVVALVAIVGCDRDRRFLETFDSPGKWRVDSDTDVEGAVRDGVYEFLVKADEMISWTTAGETFGDGMYEVEATQIQGPLDNGFGMLIRVDDENDSFYLFEISGDGYTWIGRYLDGGNAEATPIIGEGWIESSAVNKGLNATNRLRVRAESGNMIFLVNDHEVGRVTDNSFRRGDIGLMVRTLGVGGVAVQFDNFSVTPLEPLR